MAQWTRIASKSELPAAGEAKEFDCNGKLLCVANVAGDLSAMDNVCPHRGGPLGQGVIEGDKLVCPWHGWQFDAKTGAVAHAPDQKIPIYPVKVEGDDVFVEI
jgi:nitrite reductase (NADH) small subunit